MSLYTDASLIMFPSGYKEDKIYSLKPTDGSGDLTFTRASTATRVNSEGLIETSPVNLMEQSNAFSTSPWSKSAGTTLTSGQTDPNGGTTAFRLQMSSASNFIASGIFTVVSESIYTYTIYLKSNTGSNQSFRIIDGVRGVAGGVLNGTATTSWQRVELQITPNSTSGAFQLDNAGGAYSNDLLICFSQANIGATAKPYFPTTDRLNVPRIDYTGGGCGKLLLEPQRTNLATYSSEFDNAAYIKSNVAITANNTTSPDGTQNADLFTTNNAAGTIYRVYHSSIGGTDTTNTISAFFKYANHPYVFLVGDSVGAGKFGIFNIQNGTIENTSAGYTATITNYGNGWYRCTLTGTMDSTNNIQLGLTASTSTYAGTSLANGKTMYCWGAQREYNASYVSSYIPTLASSVTRLADAAFKTGISSLIGQTQGTMFIDVTQEAQNEDGRYMFISDGSNSNRIVIYQYGGVINVYSSAGAFNLTYSPPSGRLKIAFVYKSGDYALWVNGTQRVTSSTVAVATGLNSMGLSSNEGSIGTPQPIDAGVNQAMLFTTRLDNTTLATLTTL